MSKNQNTANAKSESAKTAESRAAKAEHLKKTRENIALQSFTQRLDEAPLSLRFNPGARLMSKVAVLARVFTAIDRLASARSTP